MTGNVAETYVRLRPDASGFKAEAKAQLDPQLRAIEQQITDMRAQAASLRTRTAALSAGQSSGAARAGTAGIANDLGLITARAGVATGVLYEFARAVKAATGREADLNLVGQAVENAGKSWAQYGDQVEAALDKQRRDSGFTLDEITQGFARLEQTIKDPAKALEELATAEDVARARGLSLEQVTSSISQAWQGNVSNLNTLGQVTVKVTAQQDALRAAHARLLDSGVQLSHVEQQQYADRLRAAQAADRQATAESGLASLAKRNAGQAEAYINSTAGSVSELKTSLTEIEEQVGGPFLGAVASAAHGLSSLLQTAHDLNLNRGLFQIISDGLDSDNTAAQDFAKSLADLTQSVAAAKIDVGGAKAARDAAEQALLTAREAKAEATAAVRADPTNSNREALARATYNLTTANTIYTRSVRDAQKAEQDRAAGVRDSAKDLQGLVGAVRKIADSAETAGTFGKDKVALFGQALDALAKANPGLERQIEDLAGITKAAGEIPDDVTIAVTLNPTLDSTQLTAQLTAFVDRSTALLRAQLSAGSANLLRGGLGAPPKLDPFPNEFPGERGGKAVATGAVKAAETFSTNFISHIDVGGIADAITSALDEARSNIVTQSDSIASAVGDALDERLKRTTLPLAREIEALQASLDASSQASAAANAADAVTKAQQKLDELRSVYGSGALTQGQSTEISDAQRALEQAQQSVADAGKQARISSLQDQIDTAKTAEEQRKASVTQNLADLAAEFNTGKISQERYLAGVQKILKDQELSFKSAGQLLGTAFADGFSDALKNLRAQVLVLTGDQRKGSTLTKPTSVSAAGASATQSILDQIAQSGGKFTLDNAGSLPKGVNVSALVAAAKRQREEDSYRVSSSKKQQEGLDYQADTNRHLERVVELLKSGTHVVVGADGAKKKTRATAKATQS